MPRRVGQAGAWVWVWAVATVWPGAAIAQPGVRGGDDPAVALEADRASEADPTTELDRVMGECLAYQRVLRSVRDELREAVAAVDGRLGVLERAQSLLDEPGPSRSAAGHWRERLTELEREAATIRGWLRGEQQPEETGLTRGMLEGRLAALAEEHRDAALLARASGLEDPADRADLRQQVHREAEALKRQLQARTQPMRERLRELEARDLAERERMERLMTPIGRTPDDGPVTVMAVHTDAFFGHGHTSFRWTDRRGALVASAQVRLLPRRDDDNEPPLLLEQFPILAQSDQEAELLVGQFTVDFHVSVPELRGEGRVLEALARLLDLEALSRVRPVGGDAGQH